MMILSLEFSSNVRSVAVWPNGSPAEAQVQVTAEDERRSRIHPLALIERALREAGVDRSEVDLIAVGLGPGSYTGIRSAIAIAQGWSLGSTCKISGIPTVRALAAQAVEAGIQGLFHIVIDAQRDEFYVADFENAGPAQEERKELRIVTRLELHALTGTLIGPSLKALGLNGMDLFPVAAMIARIAKRTGDTCAASDLVPIYLRETAFVKAPPARPLPEF
jgi:tRNA threonylcarbamoyladenosine biosynthesis protein TsaB